MNHRIPSQKGIRKCLGSALADAFFELSNPTIRTSIGLTPQLEGPCEQLWYSPSDQLIGKNCMKTPVPRTITQATTHKGVLELGEKALQGYEADLREKIRKSLYAEMKDIQLLIEAKQRLITDNRIKKIEDECNWRLNYLAKEYDKKLDEALDRVIKRYNKILLKAVVQTRMNVTHEMMKKMRNEIEFVVTDMNADYERKFCIERLNIISDFNQIIRTERMTMKEEMKQFQQRINEEFEASRAKLENETAENTEKFVRYERMQCVGEKQKIQENFENIILSLQRSLAEANRKMKEFKETPPIIMPSNDEFWRNRIRHILKEFETFIQFVLISDQRTYLLPRESLLRFPEDIDSIDNGKLEK